MKTQISPSTGRRHPLTLILPCVSGAALECLCDPAEVEADHGQQAQTKNAGQ